MTAPAPSRTFSRRCAAGSTTYGSDREENHERRRFPVRRKRWGGLMALALLLSSSAITTAAARDIAYCSDMNTSEDEAHFDGFQSNGACYDYCKDSYAFAIVQGTNCWCSNYAPGGDEYSDCTDTCPGYPDDKCGNVKEDLYGYMTLLKKPSGTMEAEEMVSSTSPLSDRTTVLSVETTRAVITTTATKTTTKSTKKTTPTTFTTSRRPTGVIVVTSISNGVKTVVVTPTSALNSVETSKSSENFFSNGGRVAGLVIGLLVALLLIVGAVIFWRRRRAQLDKYGGESTHGMIAAGGAGVVGGRGRGRSRSMSTLGLVGEKSPPASTTPPNAGPLTAAAGEITPSSEAVYDQRLDPGSLFMKFDHQTGSSRMSVRSLRDDQDYSRRVLRLANPDE